jgi:hypothetical protein
MKEPQRIKLTDSPISKKVNLIPLPSLIDKYPDRMSDDVYIKPLETYEDNQQDNSEIVQ